MKQTHITTVIVFSVLIFAALVSCVPVSAALVSSTSLPEGFNFGENYYTVYGNPNLSASLIGDNLFDRGDEVTLDINLMNKGVITSFRSENDFALNDADTDLNKKLEQTEMQYEAMQTTAIGIVASLVSEYPEIKIKSGPQEAGTLASGETLESPLRFNIEVSKDAKPGLYPLGLGMLYGYQKNVQVDGKNETDTGIKNLEVGLWYESMMQNAIIIIEVDSKADFVASDAMGTLHSGEENVISVTYRNTGDLPVKDAVVRISVIDPFSTSDDQAYLGDMTPGESAIAKFKLKVDGGATVKAYIINSEIRYEDVDGNNAISDVVKFRVNTLPPIPASEKMDKFKPIVWLFVISIVVYAGFRLWKRKNMNE